MTDPLFDEYNEIHASQPQETVSAGLLFLLCAFFYGVSVGFALGAGLAWWLS